MEGLLLPENACCGNNKKVKDVKPFGSMILVQRLTPAESMGTDLFVSEMATATVPQVRIVEFGPNIKADEVGLKVGDRLVCVGNATLVPSLDGKHEYNVLELHNIKAVIHEHE